MKGLLSHIPILIFLYKRVPEARTSFRQGLQFISIRGY
uniref:Uncharacterized protein n=1 Tax=Arundo donax TaxID=35708 RepID=A0A0A9BMX5_ARUDO